MISSHFSKLVKEDNDYNDMGVELHVLQCVRKEVFLDTPFVYFIYILDFPTQLFGSQQNM